MWFYYDNAGKRVAVEYNGEIYYYLYNLQGDVTGLLDDDLNQVVSYYYNPWGELLYVSGSEAYNIGQDNPFLYRGYFFDAETGFYYLNSRYYDPETGRFINADDFLATGKDLFSHNAFCYCENNPIIRIDTTGYAWETVFDIVSLGFSIAEVAANPYDVGAWVGLVGDAIDLIPFVTGVGEVARGLRFVDKVGNTLEIAEAVDFTSDTKKIIKKLDNVDGFTKSSRIDGINIHKGYKKGKSFSTEYKEYNRINGIRPDYFDGETIYELKPFNPKSAKQGIKQLKKYSERIKDWRIARLEFY